LGRDLPGSSGVGEFPEPSNQILLKTHPSAIDD